jgi:hypothetical protein
METLLAPAIRNQVALHKFRTETNVRDCSSKISNRSNFAGGIGFQPNLLPRGQYRHFHRQPP